jgi:two-component system response regulator ResD
MEQKKIILLIEDENDIRKIYAEVLTEAGFTVKEAADGTQGIQMAKNEPWDLMLLDIMLPGEDGIHVLKDLKQVPTLVEKPVLLLTNLENETIIAECFDMGADGYVIKSEITPDYIVAEVKKYIQA